MDNIVFLTPNTQEPFTTSDVIAEMTGNSYRSVQRIIEKQQARLERFGRVRFEITPLQTKGGIQNKKIYHLNEQQATLLMTFLKNTDVVADFKTELVRQFYAMRFELYKTQAAKAERKPVRASMTDAIKALPDSPHKAFKYGQFTNLAYLLALGKTAKQLRKERGAAKTAIASDYMTAEEITLVAEIENKIAVLIGIGMSYQAVKESLAKKSKS